MKILASIVCSLLISAVILAFLSKAEYDQRLQAAAADAALVLKSRGEDEVGPQTCNELAASVDLIRTRTTTSDMLGLAALDLQKAYSQGCMAHAEASEALKDLKREFNARFEREEQNFKATNMVLAIHWFFKPSDRPKQNMPELAEKSGLFKLPSADVSR